jgi:hypothetical protein
MRKNDIRLLGEAYTKKIIKEDLFDTNFDEGDYGNAFDNIKSKENTGDGSELKSLRDLYFMRKKYSLDEDFNQDLLELYKNGEISESLVIDYLSITQGNVRRTLSEYIDQDEDDEDEFESEEPWSDPMSSYGEDGDIHNR